MLRSCVPLTEARCIWLRKQICVDRSVAPLPLVHPPHDCAYVQGTRLQKLAIKERGPPWTSDG